LIDQIASGNLTVVNRPNERIRAFQEKMKAPLRKQKEKLSTERWMARHERDRLRQEQIRRAAGIAPRGAQEALE
jgi:hypothetical protein